MASPTQRTLAYFRGLGMKVDVTERWIPRVNIRKDLFGFIDMVALDFADDLKSGSIVGIQATSGSHHAERIAKALDSGNLKPWLACGGRFCVVSWRKLVKYNKDGSKAKLPRWAGRQSEVILLSSGKITGTETEL